MYSTEIKNNNSQPCLHILIPQIWRAARLWFGESLRWRMYLMSHPSLPALPVSNVSFHTSRLPADWSLWSRCYRLFQRSGFKRRQSLLGLRTYLLSTSSSPPLPPVPSFMFPFSSLPRRLRVFVFSLFFPLSSRDRWEQTAWQFSSPFSSAFLFSVCGCSLCIPLWLPLCFLQIELREDLDLPFWRRGVSFGVFLPADTQPHGFGPL